MKVKTAYLTKLKFPSAQFFELTQRKVRKIKKFQKGHECIPKFPCASFFQLTGRKCERIKKFKKGHKCIPRDFFEVKNFNSSCESQNC